MSYCSFKNSCPSRIYPNAIRASVLPSSTCDLGCCCTSTSCSKFHFCMELILLDHYCSEQNKMKIFKKEHYPILKNKIPVCAFGCKCQTSCSKAHFCIEQNFRAECCSRKDFRLIFDMNKYQEVVQQQQGKKMCLYGCACQNLIDCKSYHFCVEESLFAENCPKKNIGVIYKSDKHSDIMKISSAPLCMFGCACADLANCKSIHICIH